MKTKQMITTVVLGCFLFACNDGTQNQQEMTNENTTGTTAEQVAEIFPQGERGPTENFTGTVWNTPLVAEDSVYTTVAGNVLFEAGARTNWHSHAAGQILIVVDGEGRHQIEGQPIEVIKKGDAVKCPPNVDHWHGAAPNNHMQHIYIVPNTEKGIVNWGEPVTDEQYTN